MLNSTKGAVNLTTHIISCVKMIQFFSHLKWINFRDWYGLFFDDIKPKCYGNYRELVC